MNPAAEALWLRALRAADARGLLPGNKRQFTPAELASEARIRGEDRLMRLVRQWYYPLSYGRTLGALSDDEAERIVTSLEREVVKSRSQQEAPPTPQPIGTTVPVRRKPKCDLCGRPVM